MEKMPLRATETSPIDPSIVCRNISLVDQESVSFAADADFASFLLCLSRSLPMPNVPHSMIRVKAKSHRSGGIPSSSKVAILIGGFTLLSFVSSLALIFQFTSLPDTQFADTKRPRHAPPAWHNASTLRPRIVRTTPTARLRNRTLVVLMGDLRCGETAWESLYRNVLDYNQADLALFTQPPPQASYRNASLWHRAMHVELVPNYTDWSDALDLVAGPDWREQVARYYSPQSHPALLGGVPGYEASGAIVNMYKWFVANRIREREWLPQYDRYLVTRTDQYYACPLDVAALDPQFLWVPQGEDYGGVTDRYLIASRDLVLAALDTLAPFLRDPRRYTWKFARTFFGHKINCEKVLLYLWRDAGLEPLLRRFTRNMYTCMAPTDCSRWGSIQGYAADTKLHLKYPKEYTATQQTCASGAVAHVPSTLWRWAR